MFGAGKKGKSDSEALSSIHLQVRGSCPSRFWSRSRVLYVDQVLEHLTITTMPLTKHRYVEWIFDRQLFEASRAGPIIEMLARAKGGPQLPPIYVNILEGGPYGSVVSKLLGRPELRTATLAQSLGKPNLFPCSHCEKLLSDSDRKEQRGMNPFLGCVSHTPYHRACGNCLMVGCWTTCE